MRVAVATVEQEADGVAVEDVDEAAVMVARGMRGDDDGEPPHARAPQQPRDAALRRAAVEEHGGAVRMLDERGVALADVEEPHGQVARRRGRAEPGVR